MSIQADHKNKSS